MSKKNKKKVPNMTGSYQMLSTIKRIKKKGVTEEQSKKYLRKSGIIDNRGEVTNGYRELLVVNPLSENKRKYIVLRKRNDKFKREE